MNTNEGEAMSTEVDYYDVQAMIRDARSEIRGEIDNAVRAACAQLRSEFADEARDLRETIASVAISGSTAA